MRRNKLDLPSELRQVSDDDGTTPRGRRRHCAKPPKPRGVKERKGKLYNRQALDATDRSAEPARKIAIAS